MLAGGVALVVTSIAIARATEPDVAIERSSVLIDSVRRGDLTREVRGAGTLVPDHVRWVTALASARVERVMVLNGQSVAAGTVILELSNPDLQIQSLQAQQSVRRAQMDLLALRTSLESSRLSQEGAVASLRTQLVSAAQESRAADTLLKSRLISPFEANTKRATLTEVSERLRIEESRLKLMTAAVESQLAAQGEQVEQLKAIARNQEQRLASLTVRAPDAGVVQDLTLQPGQWVPEGTMLAKVVQPGQLRAVLRVPESQARDVSVGMAAMIDTRNGSVAGHVTRKDPAAQAGTIAIDVAFNQMPAGAVPDLGVDGVIQVERIRNVLLVGKPFNGAATSSVFRLEADGKHASRTAVSLGRESSTSVEIVRGLQRGDVVILSDMSAHSGADRIRLK